MRCWAKASLLVGWMAGCDDPVVAQIERGSEAYSLDCRGCHGDAGQGTDLGPRLIGLAQGALPVDPPPDRLVRTESFVTFGDVAAFVVAQMPPDAPGALSDDDYWDILAFVVDGNGVALEAELNPDLADGLPIPR